MPVAMPPGFAKDFRSRLLDWFEANSRDLPWRTKPRDPYRVWIAEVMLQQTRVDQAVPYFNRFVRTFPDVATLARADLDSVLKEWEGLGYYARARNLHKAAGQIVSEPGAGFPTDYDELLALPGVGSYTAGAVASIAFGGRHGVVDGNVARVLARVFAIADDVKSSAVRRELRNVAHQLVDPDRPGPYNEALMELGATVCTPAGPTCHECPIAGLCIAFSEDLQDALPVTKKRGPIPHFDIAVAVVHDSRGRVLVQQRPENGLLGGLWEFVGGKVEPAESPVEAVHREALEEIGAELANVQYLCTVRHAYSHFKVTIQAFTADLDGGRVASRIDQPLRWVAPGELGSLAFPRANQKIIDHLVAITDQRG